MNGVNIHPDPFLDLTKSSDRWLAMSDSGRIVCIDHAISMRTEGIELLRVEKVNHVVVRITGHDRRRWPTLLRELESLLKKEVEPSLQVYLEPRQDDSLLRLGRLGDKKNESQGVQPPQA